MIKPILYMLNGSGVGMLIVSACLGVWGLPGSHECFLAGSVLFIGSLCALEVG